MCGLGDIIVEPLKWLIYVVNEDSFIKGLWGMAYMKANCILYTSALKRYKNIKYKYRQNKSKKRPTFPSRLWFLLFLLFQLFERYICKTIHVFFMCVPYVYTTVSNACQLWWLPIMHEELHSIAILNCIINKWI